MDTVGDHLQESDQHQRIEMCRSSCHGVLALLSCSGWCTAGGGGTPQAIAPLSHPDTLQAPPPVRQIPAASGSGPFSLCSLHATECCSVCCRMKGGLLVKSLARLQARLGSIERPAPAPFMAFAPAPLTLLTLDPVTLLPSSHSASSEELQATLDTLKATALNSQAAFRSLKDTAARSMDQTLECLLWLQHSCRLTLLHCRRCARKAGGLACGILRMLPGFA